jgi:hypothetical protein
MDYNTLLCENITLLTKSNCSSCERIKKKIINSNLIINIIDCDEYLIYDYSNFINFLKTYYVNYIPPFPLIFSNKTVLKYPIFRKLLENNMENNIENYVENNIENNF